MAAEVKDSIAVAKYTDRVEKKCMDLFVNMDLLQQLSC